MKNQFVLLTTLCALTASPIWAKKHSDKKKESKLAQFLERKGHKNPLDRMNRLEKEFREFISDFFTDEMPRRSPLMPQSGSWYNEVDSPQATKIESKDPKATVKIIRLNLPGFDANDINVIRHKKNRTITVKAEHVEKMNEKSDDHVSFWSSSMQTFQHSFELPENAQMDAISNTFSEGVLTITVPLKPEHATNAEETDNMLIFELPDSSGKKK